MHGQAVVSGDTGIFQERDQACDRQLLFTGGSAEKDQRLSGVLRGFVCAAHGRGLAGSAALLGVDSGSVLNCTLRK